MKIIIIIIFCLSLNYLGHGQWTYGNYNLTFDQLIDSNNLLIDSNSIWHVDKPSKPIFNAPKSAPNAIITNNDSASYPVNDTSSFTIRNIAGGGGFTYPHTVILAGDYFVDSDTLNDFGIIEFSPDNGKSWIDLVNDTVYDSDIWWWTKPVLSGSSNGWKEFYVNIAQLGPTLKISDGDTVLYRFTFISDSLDTKKDGLMFDDFHFEDWIEAVEEYNNNLEVKIFPNPSNEFLKIKSTNVNSKITVEIYNSAGKLRLETLINANDMLNISMLPKGLYYIHLSTTDGYSKMKFLIN